MEQTDNTIKDFFEHWKIYRALIDNNYMHHREIIQKIHDAITKHGMKDLRILELGGGDAYTVSQLIKQGVTVSHYTSVDLSSQALELAKQNLLPDVGQLQLQCGDMVQLSQELKPDYDLIITGFTLHHLNLADTKAVIKQCKRLLSENGLMFVYDILHENDENRDEFIDRFLAYDRKQWTALTAEQLESACGHVAEDDQPKSYDEWDEITREAGFLENELLFKNPSKMYALLQIH